MSGMTCNASGRDGHACFRSAYVDLRHPYLTAIRRSHSSFDMLYQESLEYCRFLRLWVRQCRWIQRFPVRVCHRQPPGLRTRDGKSNTTALPKTVSLWLVPTPELDTGRYRVGSDMEDHRLCRAYLAPPAPWPYIKPCCIFFLSREPVNIATLQALTECRHNLF